MPARARGLQAGDGLALQLALPGFGVAGTRLATVKMPRREKLVVTATGSEVHVDLMNQSATKAHLHLKLGSAPACELAPGSPSLGWPLWERRPRRAPQLFDAFEVLRQHLFAQLYRSRRRTAARTQRLKEEITEALQASERTAVRLADPDARAEARRFHPEARWFVYRGLVGSPSGRFLQLLSACPGAAVLAAAVEAAFPVYGHEAANAFLADVEAGRRLKQALRRLLEQWLTLMQERAQVVGKPERLTPATEPLSDHQLADLTLSRLSPAVGHDDAALTRQRQLVRLAHPTTPPRYLMAPAPMDLVPEDVPRSGQALLTWLRAMTVGWTWFGPCDATDSVLRAWVSCHSHELAQAARQRRCSLPTLVLALRRSCARARYQPVRSAAIDRVIRVVDEHPWKLKYPLPPPPNVERPGLSIKMLERTKQLKQEGSEMHHCVGSYAPQVASGKTLIFSIRTNDARTTLSLVPRGGRWVPSEHHGPHDAAPPEGHTRLVERWLDWAGRKRRR